MRRVEGLAAAGGGELFSSSECDLGKGMGREGGMYPTRRAVCVRNCVVVVWVPAWVVDGGIWGPDFVDVGVCVDEGEGCYGNREGDWKEAWHFVWREKVGTKALRRKSRGPIMYMYTTHPTIHHAAPYRV